MQTQSPAQQADTNAPVTNQFKPFDWHNADVAGPHGTDRDALVDLLNLVRDITYGAATVMELSLHCQFDTDEGRTPLLRPCDLGGLERLATRALMMLSDNAGRVSDRLNNQPTPEKAGQP